MSAAFRKAMANKLPMMPPVPATRAPWTDSDQVDELDELEGGDGVGDLVGFASGPAGSKSTQDLSPLSASLFFAQALEVHPPGNDTTFRTYITPPTPPSSSSSSSPNPNGTYLVCHHGAGASGLSFAKLAKHIKEKSNGELGVLAYDCRGHGKTRSRGAKDRDSDLSLKTLVDDLVGIITHLFPEPATAPALLLIGHSMGAAPILSAAPILQSKGYTVPGVSVIDVVEGTAVEALPLMKSILSGRPQSFRSVVDAIHWHVTSNSVRDVESARVSVPSFLVPAPDVTDPGPQSRQVWRTDLVATEPYWKEWYAGLSLRFVAAKCARLLVLAGQERLDKELMVGQMQGKFQLEVMQNVGHYLHEDDPVTLASTIVTFWKRNTQLLVLPPKIGSSILGPATKVKRVGDD